MVGIRIFQFTGYADVPVTGCAATVKELATSPQTKKRYRCQRGSTVEISYRCARTGATKYQVPIRLELVNLWYYTNREKRLVGANDNVRNRLPAVE